MRLLHSHCSARRGLQEGLLNTKIHNGHSIPKKSQKAQRASKFTATPISSITKIYTIFIEFYGFEFYHKVKITYFHLLSMLFICSLNRPRAVFKLAFVSLASNKQNTKSVILAVGILCVGYLITHFKTSSTMISTNF